MNTQPIYLFKMTYKAFGKGIIYILKSKPRFRILKTKNKTFIAQIFIGHWKIGFYMDMSYIDSMKDYDYPSTFENKTLDEAESIICKAISNHKVKSFIVKEYNEKNTI